MSLELPQNFRNDIQGRDTALVPVVYIGTYPSSEYIVISTNQNPVADKTLPLLLNIPSLKESIDIEKRNYKISAVNLDISNYEYEGKRFSELVSGSLISTEVRIFWTSPSANGIHFIPSEDNDAFLVYFGTIRRYTHDDEKVRLVVEDRSQATLHKYLPLEKNYLEQSGNIVPDKYKGKPKPFVYGYVEKSPGVISYSPPADEFGIDTGFINVIFDNSTESKTIAGDNLYLYKDDGYYTMPQTIQEEYYTYLPESERNVFGYKFPIGENTNIQYINELSGSNIVQLVSENNFDFGNPIYNDNILVRESKTPINKLIISPTKKIVDGTLGVTKKLSTSLGLRLDSLHQNQIVGTMMREGIQTHHWQGTSSLDGVNRTHNYSDLSNITNQDLSFDGIGQYEGSDDHIDSCEIGFTAQSEAFNFDDQTAFWIVRIDFYVTNRSSIGDSPYLNEATTMYFIADIGDYPAHEIVDISGSVIPEFGDTIPGMHTWNNLQSIDKFYPDISGTGSLVVKAYLLDNFKYQFAANINVDKLVKNEWGLIKNVLKQQYCANINGRVLANPSMPMIIADIMDKELGVTVIKDDDFHIMNNIYNPNPVDAWNYAFTVDKKINSKKLIEGIASVSPYIPRFNNMGNFKFDVIPPTGGTADHTIKEADCIDFSFSRSKIESVYSKIVFKYNWDYARGGFNDSVGVDIYSVLPYDGADYDFDYYDFTIPEEVDDVNGGLIHPDSTLTIDDDRGKYIRDQDTAERFAAWFVLWSCNQHLKVKVKLPLKYMNLEIGDMVDFDAILGGVKPYGINYITGSIVNGQDVFATFLITSTNKTLEWVEIECIQMHNLDPGCLSYDCHGDCNGTVVVDVCDVCGGDGSTCLDCNGDIYGSAELDGCNICVGGNTGLSACPQDCNDVYGGSAVNDECGVCEGDGYAANCVGSDSCNNMDCLGICGGDAEFDACDECNPPSDCTPCYACMDDTSMNWNPYACKHDASLCLSPIINNDYCPVDEYLPGIPYDNSICTDHANRCTTDLGGLVLSNNTWNSSLYNDPNVMYDEIRDYCMLNSDKCTQGHRDSQENELDTEFPLILNGNNCDCENCNAIEATKVELVFDRWNGSTYEDVEVLKLWDKNTIEFYAPNPPPLLEFETQVLHNLGDTTVDEYPEDIKVRISFTYPSVNYSEADVEMKNSLWIWIGNPNSIEEGDWEEVTEWTANNTVANDRTLMTSAGEESIEFSITPSSMISIHEWDDYYFGDEEFHEHRLKFRLISTYDLGTESDIVAVDTSDIIFNIVKVGECQPGDMNNDGYINEVDMNILSKCIHGSEDGTILPNSCESNPLWACAGDMVEPWGVYDELDQIALFNCMLDDACEG